MKTRAIHRRRSGGQPFTRAQAEDIELSAVALGLAFWDVYFSVGRRLVRIQCNESQIPDVRRMLNRVLEEDTST